MKKLLFVLFCLISLLTNCSFFTNKEPTPQFTTGIFVVQHNSDTSTISYFDTIAKRVVNNVYYMQNKLPLDAQAQSMTIFNGRGYIVLSNKNQIRVVNASTLQEIGIISEGLANCRYFLGVNETTAYVTCWGTTTKPYVAVVDLSTLKVNHTIEVGTQPEKMVVSTRTGTAFVANSGDSTLSLINTNTHGLTDFPTIEVGTHPSGLVLDKYNRLWVLCSGKPSLVNQASTQAALYQIKDTLVGERVIKTVPIGDLQTNPANLSINVAKDRLYFSLINASKAVYSYALTDTVVDLTTKIISRAFSQMSIDPNTDELYGYDVSTNYVSRYKLPNAAKLDSFIIVYPASDFSFQPLRMH